jgi:hypothetical protein
VLLKQPEGAEEQLELECIILFCDIERKSEVYVFIKHMNIGEMADLCISPSADPLLLPMLK